MDWLICCHRKDFMVNEEEGHCAKLGSALLAERDTLIEGLKAVAPTEQVEELQRIVKAIDTESEAELSEQQYRGISIQALLEAERQKCADALAQCAQLQCEVDDLRRMTQEEVGTPSTALPKELDGPQLEPASPREGGTPLPQCLLDIDTKLESAEASWTPWKEIGDLREHVASIQTEAQCPEALRGQVEALEEEQRALQLELATSSQKHRSSFSLLSQNLSEVSNKIETAQTSWSPWEELQDVKEKVGNMNTMIDEAQTRLIGG